MWHCTVFCKRGEGEQRELHNIVYSGECPALSMPPSPPSEQPPSPDIPLTEVHQRLFTVGSYFRQETSLSENPKWLASCACKNSETYTSTYSLYKHTITHMRAYIPSMYTPKMCVHMPLFQDSSYLLREEILGVHLKQSQIQASLPVPFSVSS